MCHWKFVKKKKCQISSENIQSDLTRNAIHLLLINARQTEWISLMNVKYVAGFCSKVLARPCMKIEHNLRNRYGISIMPITPNDQYINSCWLSMIIRNIHCSAAPTQCSAMDFRNKHSVHAFHLSTIHFDVATHGPCCVHCSPIAQIICLTLMHTKCRIYSKSVLLRWIVHKMVRELIFLPGV